MCRQLARLSCDTPTASCVMSTTTAKAALFSAAREMMLSDTSLAASVEKSYATLAGRDNTALNVSGFGFNQAMSVSLYGAM